MARPIDPTITDRRKVHPVSKMSEKVEEVGQVDDLIRAGQYQAALELTRKYGFYMTPELKRWKAEQAAA
mgnify:FL=1